MPETKQNYSTIPRHENLTTFDKWRRARILRLLKEKNIIFIMLSGIEEELASLGYREGEGVTDG